MDHDAEQEEIKPLIFNYVFHFILYALIFIMHLVMQWRIYWVIDSLKILFLFGTYLNILYFIFPIFPLIFIFLKKYKVKIINSIKTISFILLIISITFGLMISIVLLINSINSKIFCRECPFNLQLSHLNEVFEDYYGKSPSDDEIKNECNSRRCVLDREENDAQYPYIYLCNYNPTDEFSEDELYKRQLENGTEISTNTQLRCQTVTANYNLIYFKNSELISYLDLCYFLADFYVCKRFNKPEKYYNLGLKDSCPENNYLLLLFILCVLIIIIDVIISLLPWGVEYMSLKRIIAILSQTRRRANSNNSTAKSSEISNNEESFKKEKTPVLIIFDDNGNNENKNENIKIGISNDLILQLNKSTFKDSRIKLNPIHEEDKGNNNKSPINFKHLQNSERNSLNQRNILIDVESNKLEIQKDFPNRRTENKINEHNTTIYSNQVRQINIQIDNQNTNSKN